MPAIDLSILNQRQTPAFYADTLANRPSAGFIGRIFVSTDTFAFYRDNGTTWDLIGGPGTGTVTGTGANGQVTYWNGASTITGSNDLFFDAVNGHLGIGTVTPGTALDVKHDQSTVVQLEQITATNDIRIAFINSGVGLWRLGAFYNAGANDFGLFDIAAATQPVTVKRTTGQVLIGTSTVGSGKLVVASATGDNGVQIVGASAPSLRIDNAESGPTKRVGLGISTATNNFIQGSADRDFCIFNGSTTASPILFGIYGTTNVLEAARISVARNFLIGTTTDSGEKLTVGGNIFLAGTSRNITFGNNSFVRENAASGIELGFVSTNPSQSIKLITGTNDSLVINNVGNSAFTPISGRAIDATSDGVLFAKNGGSHNIIFGDGNVRYYSLFTPSGAAYGSIRNFSTSTDILAFTSGGNVLIGTTTDAGQKLQVNGKILSTDLIQTNLTGGLVYRAYWGSGNNRSLDINIDQANGDSQLTWNTTYNGGWKYFLDNYSSRIGTGDGIYFSVAPLGTAGNTITWNDAMSIKANGNVLIGTTTSGASKLRIVGLPTSAVGLSSGDVYSNAGILTIVP